MDSQTREVVEVNRRFSDLLGCSLPEDAPLFVKKVVADAPRIVEKIFDWIQQQRILPPEHRIFQHKNGRTNCCYRGAGCYDAEYSEEKIR